MLPPRDTTTHHPPTRAPTSPDQSDRPGDARSDPLAHELANLIDASLRNVGLALGELRSEANDPAIRKLERVSQAMHRMSGLLHQWMSGMSEGSTAAGREADRLGPSPPAADPSQGPAEALPDWPGDTSQRASSPDSGTGEPTRRTTGAAPASLDATGATLGQTLEDAAELFRPIARSRGVALRLHVAPDANERPAGPIYPLVVNGLRNALDALDDAGGEIAIHAWLEGENVNLTIGDDGPGLDPALLDASGRFTPGRTTKPSGHGVGLSLAWEIAHALGGGIELRNRDGGGCELRLTYPTRRPTGDAASDQTSASA